MSDGSQTWGGVSADRSFVPRTRALGHRLLGGPPVAVAARLVFASLVVGAAMIWLRIEPTDVLVAVANFAHHLYVMGFLAAGQLGRYALAGAAIVVPLWIVARLLSFRGTR